MFFIPIIAATEKSLVEKISSEITGAADRKQSKVSDFKGEFWGNEEA